MPEDIIQVTEANAEEAAIDGIMFLTCPVCGGVVEAEPDAQSVYCDGCDCIRKINNWIC